MNLFTHPITIGFSHLWLVVPLCMVVAIVYKTVRVPHLRRLPGQVLILWAYILIGLAALGAALHLLLEYVA